PGPAHLSGSPGGRRHLCRRVGNLGAATLSSPRSMSPRRRGAATHEHERELVARPVFMGSRLRGNDAQLRLRFCRPDMGPAVLSTCKSAKASFECVAVSTTMRCRVE